MASIFSTQNLHTFLRRKYLRPPGPPSRPPPGPPGRGGRRSPRSGRSPPEDDPEDDSDEVGLVSSAMMLLDCSRWSSVVGVFGALVQLANDRRPTTNDDSLRCRRRSFSSSLRRRRGRRSFPLRVLDR